MWKQRLELFRGLVPEETLREGVQIYKDHRVKCVAKSGDDLIGFVELDTAWNVAKTEVSIYLDGQIAGICTCGSPEKICPHVVATVLGTSKIAPKRDLRESALRAVRRAGKRVVTVEPIAVDERGFGTWSAQTMGRHRPGVAVHMVEIYSQTELANQCTCAEFEFDQLGTCRHIEGVLHRLGPVGEPPRSVVYVDWAEEAPRLRILWGREHRERRPDGVARLFDEEGYESRGARASRPRAIYEQDVVDVGLGARQLVDRENVELERIERATWVLGEMRALGVTESFRGNLQPFQQEGVRFLVRHGRAVLADEMGLGKTVQAIAAADWMMELGEVERVLVICPASIKVQWQREIQRFTTHQAAVLEGDYRRRLASYRSAPPFLMANYELVMRDAAAIARLYAPDLVIVDEAQRIKNRDTLTAAAVKSIPARFRFALTGTPVENDRTDLFSIMELLDPTVLGPFWRFPTLDSTDIHALTKPRILRRRRSILAEQLPERTTQPEFVRISGEQHDYQQCKVAAARQIKAQADKEKRPMTPGEEALMFGLLTKARMASNGMFLIDGKTKESAKVDRLLELLDELREEGRKVVVFSEWVRMIEFVRDILNERGIGSLFLHGGVPSSRRADLIDQFSTSPDIDVFFSTEAGGVGLNLQAASAVINLDLPWNPARLDQRAGRVHRLGQTRDVRVIHLIGTGYEKDRIWPKLQGKRRLAGRLLEPEVALADTVVTERKLAFSARQPPDGGCRSA